MHSVLNIPPAWVLVWPSGAEKSFPCRADPLLHLLVCPSLIAGLSPWRGVRTLCAQEGLKEGNSSVGVQLQQLLSAVSWEHGQKGLMLVGHLTVEMFMIVVAFSLFRPQQFFFSVTDPFSSFCLKPLWKPSENYMPFSPYLTSISLQRCLEQTASLGLQPMNPPMIRFKCNH